MIKSCLTLKFTSGYIIIHEGGEEPKSFRLNVTTPVGISSLWMNENELRELWQEINNFLLSLEKR